MKDLAKAKADIYDMVKDILTESDIKEQRPKLDIEAAKKANPILFQLECLCYRIISLANDCKDILEMIDDEEDE